eukprot:g2673.t1
MTPQEAIQTRSVQWLIDHAIGDQHFGTNGKREKIIEITTTAVHERTIEKSLSKTATFWQTCQLTVRSIFEENNSEPPMKKEDNKYCLAKVDELLDNIDDSLITLRSIISSKYSKYVRINAIKLKKDISMLQRTIKSLLECQQKWIDLVPIFSSFDMKRQLPLEAAIFEKIDNKWKAVMEDIIISPLALQSGTVKGRAENCESFCRELEKIQSSLHDFMETKRQTFPRFYFLANDELLTIYANSRNPFFVQRFLQKLFSGIDRLIFTNENEEEEKILLPSLNFSKIRISSLVSQSGEEITLMSENLKPVGFIERWLSGLESGMKRTIKQLIKVGIASFEEYKSDRNKWIVKHPSQVIQTASLIMWTNQTEIAIRENRLVDYQKELLQQIQEIVQFIRSENLTKRQRRIATNVVIGDVSGRDKIQLLLNENVRSTSAFNWICQLRLYWRSIIDLKRDEFNLKSENNSSSFERKEVFARQINTLINYGNEYQGCKTRLVITPLTDRCYMTITGAIQLKLGAAPSGPAGTGKTETVKNLATELGTLCFVFNCSEQFSYKLMGKLFAGLATQGAWACFDEFNRISIQVLSVVAQQLFVLRHALYAAPETNETVDGVTLPGDSCLCNFEGRSIKIREFCVNVTMNPGYQGRFDLPDSLLKFFRPIAMMIPDYKLIAEIMLFSQGYEDAHNLSSKIVQLFMLSSEQLSQQPHYDYGLRAIKSLLLVAGELKRDPIMNKRNEAELLIYAAMQMNVPKFMGTDIDLFKAILIDLFPSIDISCLGNNLWKDNEIFLENIKSYENSEILAKKIIQLKDTSAIRHGTALIGPSMTGKSTSYQLLSKCYNSKEIKMDVIYQKSVSLGELYGEFNAITREWKDGIVPKIFRSQTLQNVSKKVNWIIFDGPIDALWIENMNTVLDDNKKLSLASGETITLNKSTRLFFESENLVFASPATVSRLGIVYYPNNCLKPQLHWKNWLKKKMKEKCTDPAYQRLYFLFNSSTMIELNLNFFPSISNQSKLASEERMENIVQLANQRVISMCKIFETLWFSKEKEIAQLHGKSLIAAIDHLFVFSMIWGMAGNLTYDGRRRYDHYIRPFLIGENSKIGNNLDFENFQKKNFTVFDFFYNIEVGKFSSWDNDMNSVFDSSENSVITIPTNSTRSISYLLQKTLFYKVNFEILLTGKTATGKTMMIQNFLNSKTIKKENHAVSFCFTANIKSNKVQDHIVNEGFNKQSGNRFCPKDDKKTCTIFIDDCNVNEPEKYGAQPPLELLRQLIEKRCIYPSINENSKENSRDFYSVENTVFLFSTASGGRNLKMPQRIVRHFTVVNCPIITSSIAITIFSKLLSQNLLENDFPKSIQKLVHNISDATVSLYNWCVLQLRPTPEKSHYTFNFRDIIKCLDGLFLIEKFPGYWSSERYLNLWMHETSRVFNDRLICEKDRNSLKNEQLKLLKSHFNFDKKINSLFCDFTQGTSEKQAYRETTIETIESILYEEIENYNVTAKSRNLSNMIFFKETIFHIARLSRILRLNYQSALLVGICGSGKRTIAKVSCILSNTFLFAPESRQNYKLNDFREDLKRMIERAVLNDERVAFLLSDSQLNCKDSLKFLQDVNELLNSSEIKNLYEMEEKMELFEKLNVKISKDEKKKVNLTEDGKNIENSPKLFKFLKEKIQENFQFIVCISPIGNLFRNYCKLFPSLLNQCTIDWYDRWPYEALQTVASHSLQSLEESHAIETGKLAILFSKVHLKIQKYQNLFYEKTKQKIHTSPKSFLNLLKLFKKMFLNRYNEIETTQKRFERGQEKIKTASNQVILLQKKLNEMKPILFEKEKETKILVENVEEKENIAQSVIKIIKKEEKIALQKANEVERVAQDAQSDLDEALPALQSAVQGLSLLSKTDLVEMKSYVNPPKGVLLVAEAICLMLNVKGIDLNSRNNSSSNSSFDYWTPFKGMMGNVTDFMNRLRSYNKESLQNKPQLRLRLKKYATDPILSDQENMKSISKAASSMAMWIVAMYGYGEVSTLVKPKREKLLKLKKDLQSVYEALAEKQNKLNEANLKLNLVRNELSQVEVQKNEIKIEIKTMKSRLERAEKLVQVLDTENLRWGESSIQYLKKLDHICGDIFIASSFISYLAPFTGTFREFICKDWHSLLGNEAIKVSSKELNLFSIVGSNMAHRQWQLNGLPSDNTSADNACILENTLQWPLLIDPQEQGVNWLIRKYDQNSKEEKLIVNKFSKSEKSGNELRTDLENCISNGYTFILRDLKETIPSLLESILHQTFFTNSNGEKIAIIGDKSIIYNSNFQFYLTTKLSNPNYLPETAMNVCLINFTVTRPGLEAQLLSTVVQQKCPNVEEKRLQLMLSIASNTTILKEAEENVLSLLSNAKGNILDDEELLVSLQESKHTAARIKIELKESMETKLVMERKRNEYKDVAVRGCILFLCTVDMSHVNGMYQYSLEYFSKLFLQTLLQEKSSKTLEQLVDILTIRIVQSISRGLFQRDRVLFLFLLSVEIKNLQVKKAFKLLLSGPTIKNTNSGMVQENPVPDVLSDKNWKLIREMEFACQSRFHGLSDAIVSQPDLWRKWSKQKNLFRSKKSIPNFSNFNCNEIELLLLIKAFRIDQLYSSISQFNVLTLGKECCRSTVTTSLNEIYLKNVYKDSSCHIPVLFITSRGVDPTEVLYEFSIRNSQKLKIIALGQGQEKRIQRSIEESIKSGDWILLQNCHVDLEFLPKLSEKISKFQNSMFENKNFRLWMTTMENDKFPFDLLQSCLTLTCEAPHGVRSQLNKALGVLKDDFCSNVPGVRQEDDLQGSTLIWNKLLFSLAFFHATIMERHTFNSLGFNGTYNFNETDLRNAKEQIRDLIVDASRSSKLNSKYIDFLPWKAIQFVVSELCYGGRVTDIMDRICVMESLLSFLSPEKFEKESKFLKISKSKETCNFSSFDKIWNFVQNSVEDNNDPAYFGLHPNASIKNYGMKATELLQKCLHIPQKNIEFALDSNNEENIKSDENVKEIAISILRKLPKFLFVENNLMKMSSIQSQECKRYNNLISLIQTTLNSLLKALSGLKQMSSELQSIQSSLSLGDIPELWVKNSFASTKRLAQWMDDLNEKVHFMKHWITNQNLRVEKEIEVVWLGALFFPQGFLSSIRQRFARRWSIPVEKLTYAHSVLKTNKIPNALGQEKIEKWKDGVLLSGFYLDSGKYVFDDEDDDANNDGQLMKSNSSKELFTPLSFVHFQPALSEEMNVKEEEMYESFGVMSPSSRRKNRRNQKMSKISEKKRNIYSCPVYKTTKRAGQISTTGQSSNFICTINLPCSLTSSHWTLAGTAIVCGLD